MNKNISLVVFNEKEPISWGYGEKYVIEYTIESFLEIYDLLLKEAKDYILFWDGSVELPLQNELISVMQSKGNLWHIGPKIGTNEYPKLLDDIKPTDMLHTLVDPSIDHTSWKISFKGVLMKKDILEFIPLAHYSNSLDSIALDFGYKAIKSGVLTRYSKLLAKNHFKKNIAIQAFDEFCFVKDNFDKKALLWTYIMNLGKISPFQFWKLFKSPKKIFEATYSYLNDNHISLKDQPTDVSIVIATLERYEVLQNELEELSRLNLLPKEIIIVDQTPKEKRQRKFIEKYDTLPIKYFETDTIGQCSARNLGIENATGTYVWFLDDDMEEIPEGYLKKHLETLYYFDADVSCGIPDEIGTNYIDRSEWKVEISDGFPTNDVLVKRSLLNQVGGFDVKMDQMQSEDQEIGLRLIKLGALSIKNNQLRIVHLRASRGGLRNHDVRKITFSSSRNNVSERRLLHHSEIYLNLKHFSKSQVNKMILLNIRGTFVVRGGIIKKFIKIGIGLFYLPNTIKILKKKYSLANKLIED